MIALDTNVLVRYLVQDDPVQTPLANQVIERALADGEELWLNKVVLCELVWVLGRSYRYPKAILCEVLEKILLARQFHIQDKNRVWQALRLFKHHRADFADCLIGTDNHDSGCTTTFTFDKAAATLATFELLTAD